MNVSLEVVLETYLFFEVNVKTMLIRWSGYRKGFVWNLAAYGRKMDDNQLWMELLWGQFLSCGISLKY